MVQAMIHIFISYPMFYDINGKVSRWNWCHFKNHKTFFYQKEPKMNGAVFVNTVDDCLWTLIDWVGTNSHLEKVRLTFSFFSQVLAFWLKITFLATGEGKFSVHKNTLTSWSTKRKKLLHSNSKFHSELKCRELLKLCQYGIGLKSLHHLTMESESLPRTNTTRKY